jgi:hypothetical protein
MRNLESPDRPDGQEKCFVGFAIAFLRAQIVPKLSQDAKDARPIETLAFAVIAEVRHGICPPGRVAIRTCP